ARPPSVLVIISAMSAMLGMLVIVGLCPGVKTGAVILLIGDEVRSRNLLPDCTSQSDICPVPPIIATCLASAVNSTSIGTSLVVSERNSRPFFMSQSLTWLPRVKDAVIVGWGSSRGP